MFIFFFKQKTAYDWRISDWSSDVCSSDLRGWALAALTGELSLPAVPPSIIRALVEQRVDPVLFAMSHDYVGDLAETVALILPQPEVHTAAPEDPALSVIVVRLQSLTRPQPPSVMAHMRARSEARRVGYVWVGRVKYR